MPRLPEDLRDETPTMAGPAVGDVLNDQFRIDGFLGRGGMGEVYRGTDLHLERPVAIKLLPPTLLQSQRAAKALKKEAAQAIELTHRALARIYHFGVSEERTFLVMELVEGETLAELLDREETLEPARVVELLHPLADGLDHAHRSGVVHRDVKPSNILLRADGSPVLIDFGIAAEVRDQTTRASGTMPSETLGTLSYMSPEQVRGKRPRPSMDVYALAATAYEMLGGEPPFFRGDPMNVQYQILNEPPEDLEDVPAPVMAAVQKGLAKDPEARFPSASAFVAALAGEAPPVDVGAETVVDTPAVDVGAATVVEEPAPEPAPPTEPEVPPPDPAADAPANEEEPREVLHIEADPDPPPELPDGDPAASGALMFVASAGLAAGFLLLLEWIYIDSEIRRIFPKDTLGAFLYFVLPCALGLPPLLGSMGEHLRRSLGGSPSGWALPLGGAFGVMLAGAGVCAFPIHSTRFKDGAMIGAAFGAMLAAGLLVRRLRAGSAAAAPPPASPGSWGPPWLTPLLIHGMMGTFLFETLRDEGIFLDSDAAMRAINDANSFVNPVEAVLGMGTLLLIQLGATIVIAAGAARHLAPEERAAWRTWTVRLHWVLPATRMLMADAGATDPEVLLLFAGTAWATAQAHGKTFDYFLAAAEGYLRKNASS